MVNDNSSNIHVGRCHAFYVGDGYNLVKTSSLRLDIIELVNMIPTALFVLFLLGTLPLAAKRFCRGGKGQTGLVAYFVLIWLAALFRGLRFVILWAVMGGDAPSHVTPFESVLYLLCLAVSDTVEASFLLLFANGIFGNPKWLDRRVMIQSAAVFFIIATTQLLLTFVGKLSLYEDDSPSNAPFWFSTELCFTLAYLLVISFKFIPGPRDRFPSNPLLLAYLIPLAAMHGLSALGQGLMIAKTPNAFCPLIVGNMAYYWFSAPLLYATFLGSYLHPRCCSLSCCKKMRYSTLVGDDSLYEYQPVDTLPIAKNWIPPSQLNISSPYYPRNGSGYYLNAANMSESDLSGISTDETPRGTGDSDYDFVTSLGRPVN